MEQGYSLYKNMDLDMVKEIKKLTIPSEIFDYYEHKNSKIIQILNENQNLCIDNNNIYFICSYKNIEDQTLNNKIDLINENFNVVDALNKTFGGLYTDDGYKKLVFNNAKSFGKTISCNFEGVDFSTHNGISIKISDYSSGMFCHLNENGDIENRDYNLNLNHYIGKNITPKTKEDLINAVINKIPNIIYKNYGRKWFCDEFVYILQESDKNSLNLVKIKKTSDSIYGRGQGRQKLPSKTVNVNRNHILEHILPIINNIYFGEPVDLFKYLDKSTVKIEEVKRIKRIQETFINESYYDEIYDLSENVFDEKILKSLDEIEHSINIPDNVNIIMDYLHLELPNYELPSFSFSKGEEQETHENFNGLVKFSPNCNFIFKVCEGECVELTRSSSIYQTDIIDLEFIY